MKNTKKKLILSTLMAAALAAGTWALLGPGARPAVELTVTSTTSTQTLGRSPASKEASETERVGGGAFGPKIDGKAPPADPVQLDPMRFVKH